MKSAAFFILVFGIVIYGLTAAEKEPSSDALTSNITSTIKGIQRRLVEMRQVLNGTYDASNDVGFKDLPQTNVTYEDLINKTETIGQKIKQIHETFMRTAAIFNKQHDLPPKEPVGIE